MSGVFLSYRRDDSSGWAGRLYEHLLREFGPDQVFMDIDGIAPGEDFRVAVNRTLETCEVVLVVIGPAWLGVTDDAGRRRLDDEGDNHRAEVIAALDADVRVVPVLVGGAEMPTAGQLPNAMRDLAFRNAAVIEDRRFASDVRALLDSLARYRESRRSQAGGTRDVRPARAAPRRAGSRPAATPTLPVVLSTAGLALVLVWGVLVPRDWHSELTGLRVGTAFVVLAVAGAGLWFRRWDWVLAGAIGGIVGLGLWVVQLLSGGHSMNDLLSPGTDGVPNLITWVGMLLLFVGGLTGLRATVGAPSTP